MAVGQAIRRSRVVSADALASARSPLRFSPLPSIHAPKVRWNRGSRTPGMSSQDWWASTNGTTDVALWWYQARAAGARASPRSTSALSVTAIEAGRSRMVRHEAASVPISVLGSRRQPMSVTVTDTGVWLRISTRRTGRSASAKTSRWVPPRSTSRRPWRNFNSCRKGAPADSGDGSRWIRRAPTFNNRHTSLKLSGRHRYITRSPVGSIHTEAPTSPFPRGTAPEAF